MNPTGTGRPAPASRPSRALVRDQYHPYVRPQESGNKTDVRWMAFRREADGRGLMVIADGGEGETMGSYPYLSMSALLLYPGRSGRWSPERPTAFRRASGAGLHLRECGLSADGCRRHHVLGAHGAAEVFTPLRTLQLPIHPQALRGILTLNRANSLQYAIESPARWIRENGTDTTMRTP